LDNGRCLCPDKAIAKRPPKLTLKDCSQCARGYGWSLGGSLGQLKYSAINMDTSSNIKDGNKDTWCLGRGERDDNANLSENNRGAAIAVASFVSVASSSGDVYIRRGVFSGFRREDENLLNN